MNRLLDTPERISREYSKWRQESELIGLELDLYSALLSHQMIQKSKSRLVNYSGFFSIISNLQEINSQIKKDLVNSFQSEIGVKECDDLQCEEHFLSSHMVLKSKIEEHQEQVMAFKRKALGEILVVH